MREEEALGRAPPPLPPPQRSRPHVYLEFSIARRPAGRIVIELFEDLLPAPARHFQARCAAAAPDSFAGTRVHKLLSGATIFGGRSPAYTDSIAMRRDAGLRHAAPGAVSIAAADGAEFCLALAQALPLDDDYQVVGQIVKGMEVAQKVADLAIRADDAPAAAVTVERCGWTDADGEADLEGAGASAALEREEDETRNAVAEALAAAGKRKAGGAAAARPAKRKNALDAELLGGSELSDDESDSEAE